MHARGPAAAKDRSPSDDIVRGTATESETRSDSCSGRRRDQVRQVRWCVAVQAAMYHHTQLVLDALFDWQPIAVA